MTKALKVLLIELEETIVPEFLRYLASFDIIGFDLDDNETSWSTLLNIVENYTGPTGYTGTISKPTIPTYLLSWSSYFAWSQR